MSEGELPPGPAQCSADSVSPKLPGQEKDTGRKHAFCILTASARGTLVHTPSSPLLPPYRPLHPKSLQLPCPAPRPVRFPQGVDSLPPALPTAPGADTEPSVFLWNAVAILSLVSDKESSSPYKRFIA